ncbi:hypothetical protein HC891_17235 [Candidatus Gracilibacteria bacterium]|nr:hypothetical protein [Candidatus Gracilibacteria bacterium]
MADLACTRGAAAAPATALGPQPLFSARHKPAGSRLGAGGRPLRLALLAFWCRSGAQRCPAGEPYADGLLYVLLARGLRLRWSVALFAGLVLLTAPMCLVGLYGHMTKVFLGAAPLLLLGLHQLFDRSRRAWPWALLAAVSLLILLLHNGYQFVYGALATLFFGLAALVRPRYTTRGVMLRRLLVLSLCCAVLVGPLLAATYLAGRDPLINTDREDGLASVFRIDLLHFLLPAPQTYFFQRFFDRFDLLYSPFRIEQTVGLAWVGIALTVVALFARGQLALRWALFTLFCLVLALGSTPQFNGYLPLGEAPQWWMPASWLAALPGTGFMRVPGRVMTIGFVGFAVLAALGLQHLVQRWPRAEAALVGGAATLLLLTQWQLPPPMQALPTLPPFYAQLASDPERYGLLDLPLMPVPFAFGYTQASAPYMVMQMSHNKGIFAGYISRTYEEHPILPEIVEHEIPAASEITYNGQTLDAGQTMQRRLAAFGYRYVTWHKTIYPGATQRTRGLLIDLFGAQTPLQDDSKQRVYALDPAASVHMRFGGGWWPKEQNGRWAQSPAELIVRSYTARSVQLSFTPAALYDPALPGMLGSSGRLRISQNEQPVANIPVQVDTPASVALELPAGESRITLTLDAGNFSPPGDQRTLSFALRDIDITTVP